MEPVAAESSHLSIHGGQNIGPFGGHCIGRFHTLIAHSVVGMHSHTCIYILLALKKKLIQLIVRFDPLQWCIRAMIVHEWSIGVNV